MTTTLRDSVDATPSSPRRPAGRVGKPRRPVLQRPAPRPVTPRDEPRLVVSSSLAMVSLLCLWLVFQLVLLGGLSHARSQELLYREFRTQVASAIAPLGPVTPVGDPVAVVTIPAIGLEETVVEGTSSRDTLAGPGHLRTTVLPGQAGTSVLMGRAQTYGGPFGDLGALRPGDSVTTATAQGTTDFTVIDVRRAGDEIPQPLEAGKARLVLITSESSGVSSSLSSGQLIYVDADAAESFPAPAGLPSVVPTAEGPLQIDTGALPLLVLHLAALLAVTLGVVRARLRYRGALVWVVATPVALAVTWATTNVLMRLLPNLL